MRKKSGSIWLRLVLLVFVVAAILGAYYLGFQRGSLRLSKHIETGKVSSESERHSPNSPIVRAPIDETAVSEKGRENDYSFDEGEPFKLEDMCNRIDGDFRDFFTYLNDKNYVKHLEEGMDTFAQCKDMLQRLSSDPPIPAGEGTDSMMMAKNIYHFFRVLEKSDLRLIKEVLRNEEDTLEMNLDLFYRWLMLGTRCPDPEGLRPPPEVLYKYAGYFLNTIGGRAYLFRRPSPLRLLVSYYSLLIIHEADKNGINNYGIDIFPFIASLKNDMSVYPNFLFQKEYLRKLDDLSDYYLQRR